MTWVAILQLIWQIAIATIPFILLGGFAYLQTKFPSHEDLEDQRAALKDLKASVDHLRRGRAGDKERLSSIEKDLDRAPTKTELKDQISTLGERIGHLEGTMTGVERQLVTSNSYLQTLVEQEMRGK